MPACLLHPAPPAEASPAPCCPFPSPFCPSKPLRTMTEGNTPGIHHRTKSATTHSLHPGSIASSAQPPSPAGFHHVAATTTLTMQVLPVDRMGRGPAISPSAMPHGHLLTTAPKQMGAEHMNRPQTQRDEIRLPYSSASTGVNAGERGQHPPTALLSSTLQGQLEPSFSSMNGDQLIQKQDSTIHSTRVGLSQAVDAQQQGLSLFVAKWVATETVGRLHSPNTKLTMAFLSPPCQSPICSSHCAARPHSE